MEGTDKWDAQKMLDLYIYDYLVKNNMSSTAELFANEADFFPKDVAINTPQGFLPEWWSMFWDLYTGRMKNYSGESSSEACAIPDDRQHFSFYLPPDVSAPPKTSSATSRPSFPILQEIMGSQMIPMPNLENVVNSASSMLFPGPQSNLSSMFLEPGRDYIGSSSMFLGIEQNNYGSSSVFLSQEHNYTATSSMLRGTEQSFSAYSSVFPGPGNNYNATSSMFPGPGNNYDATSTMFSGLRQNYNETSSPFPGPQHNLYASSSVLPGAGHNTNMTEKQGQPMQSLLAARMLEQEHTKRPVRNVPSTAHFPTVEHFARLLALYGGPSRREEKVPVSNQLSVSQETEAVTGSSKSTNEEATAQGAKPIQGSSSGSNNSGCSGSGS